MSPDKAKPRTWIAIPVFNNEATLLHAVKGAIERGFPIVVVDDGCTDSGIASIEGLDIEIVHHETNRGKGAALMTAARYIRAAGGTHMICFDADGQFVASDIDAFAKKVEEHPLAIIYGVRDFKSDAPGSSVFGRSFSNFWCRVTTGKKVLDSQCGFRAYPVSILLELGVKRRRFDFEVEVLVRASWAGVKLHPVPVDVSYSPPGGRVTHFRPIVDNARISRSYTHLVLRSLLPIPRKMVKPGPEGLRGEVISPWHPVSFFKALLTENSSPWELALAVTLGLFIATLPIFGLHSILIIFVATYFRLNRLLAFSVSNLCAPPFVPAFCLEVGYFLRHGQWLSEFNSETLWSQLDERFLDWVIGSVAVAPFLAVAGGVLTLGMATLAQAINRREAAAALAPPTRGITAKYGSRTGIKFFHIVMKVVGLRAAYFFLWFPVPFYFLKPAIRASMRPYLERRFPQSSALKRGLHQFRLLMEFSRSMVDQAAAMAHGHDYFSVEVVERQSFQSTLDDGRGIVLLTTHAGNWKTVISTLDITSTPVNLLLFRDPSSPVSGPDGVPEILGSARIIDPAGAFGGLIEAASALTNGEIVSIMGDRHWGGPSVSIDFFGEKANVPESPYRLARSTGSRVCAIFVARDGYRKFRVEFCELKEVEGATRSEASVAQAQEYINAVEDFLKRYPYSWFNFFDFWRTPDDAVRSRPVEEA